MHQPAYLDVLHAADENGAAQLAACFLSHEGRTREACFDDWLATYPQVFATRITLPLTPGRIQLHTAGSRMVINILRDNAGVLTIATVNRRDGTLRAADIRTRNPTAVLLSIPDGVALFDHAGNEFDRTIEPYIVAVPGAFNAAEILQAIGFRLRMPDDDLVPGERLIPRITQVLDQRAALTPTADAAEVAAVAQRWTELRDDVLAEFVAADAALTAVENSDDNDPPVAETVYRWNIALAAYEQVNAVEPYNSIAETAG